MPSAPGGTLSAPCRSSPAQKPRPAPVRITARSAWSRSTASTTRVMSSMSCGVMALSRSGRSSVTSDVRRRSRRRGRSGQVGEIEGQRNSRPSKSPVAAPLVDVLEEGHGALRGSRRTSSAPGAAGLALVVVVAGRAVGGAEHHAGGRDEQQLDPRVLGLLGDLDLVEAVVERVPDRSTAIVRPASVRLWGTLEIRLAPWVGCTMNSVREAVHVDAVLGAHARRPSAPTASRRRGR